MLDHLLSKPIAFGSFFSNALISWTRSTLSNFTASVPRLIDHAEKIVFVFFVLSSIFFEPLLPFCLTSSQIFIFPIGVWLLP